MIEVKVLGTNHTSFTVSSLDRSIAFFTKVLGFRVTSHEPREPAMIQALTGIEGADIDVAYLQAPGHALELIEYKGPADRTRVDCRVCDVGAAHIAFDVEDVQAVVDLGSQHGANLMGLCWKSPAVPTRAGASLICGTPTVSPWNSFSEVPLKQTPQRDA